MSTVSTACTKLGDSRRSSSPVNSIHGINSNRTSRRNRGENNDIEIRERASESGSIYQIPRTNRLLSVEPIFCSPNTGTGSAISVRSAFDPGSRPRGLSLEPNGITMHRSSSTPRYAVHLVFFISNGL